MEIFSFSCQPSLVILTASTFQTLVQVLLPTSRKSHLPTSAGEIAEARRLPRKLLKLPQNQRKLLLLWVKHILIQTCSDAGKSVLKTIQYKFDQFEYFGVSEKGVKQHAKMKHRISQLDGHDDLEESESVMKSPCPLCPIWIYCKCGKCEECDYISTEEGINVHIMNDHEPPEVIQHFTAE